MNIFEGATSVESGPFKGSENGKLLLMKSDHGLKKNKYALSFELTKYKLRQWCHLLSF